MNKNNTNSIPQGLAKIEYLANKAEIDDLLQKGWSYMRIYNELKSKDKISMKYVTLTILIKKFHPELIKSKNKTHKKIQKKKTIQPITEQTKEPDKETKEENPSTPEILKQDADFNSLIGNLEDNKKEKETN